jgi:hypothetical protein
MSSAERRAQVHPQHGMQNQHGDDGQGLDCCRAELVGDDRGEWSATTDVAMARDPLPDEL